MTTFPGTVAFEDDRVPVTVGIDIDKITLISGDVEIGEWPTAECTFVEKDDGSWVIEADDDSVFFLPDDPSRFAQGLVGHLIIDTESLKDTAAAATPDAENRVFDVAEGPPPKALTVVGFYALCAVTLALGIWALVSLVG